MPTTTLQDQEIMTDVLTSQKHETGMYNTMANECVTPGIRDEMLNILREEHQIQADVFNEIQKRGWYQTKPADQQQLTQTRTKFQNMQA